jgi:hypothetical protein
MKTFYRAKRYPTARSPARASAFGSLSQEREAALPFVLEPLFEEVPLPEEPLPEEPLPEEPLPEEPLPEEPLPEEPLPEEPLPEELLPEELLADEELDVGVGSPMPPTVWVPPPPEQVSPMGQQPTLLHTSAAGQKSPLPSWQHTEPAGIQLSSQTSG